MTTMVTKTDITKPANGLYSAVVYISEGYTIAENSEGELLAMGSSGTDDNDRKVIEAAIRYIDSIGGGKLSIEKGTYLIEEAPYHYGLHDTYALRIPSNIIITGEGMGVTDLKSTFNDLWENPFQGAGYILGTDESEKNENISIRDLTLDGNRGLNTRINAGGACLTRVDNAEFSRVEVKNAFGGIKLSSRDGTSGTDHFDYKGVKKIVDCIARNCTSETFLVYASSNAVISRNNIENAGYWIYNNQIGWAHTISAERSNGVIICENNIEIPVADSALLMSPMNFAGILLTGSTDVIVSHNRIFYASSPEIDSTKFHSIMVYNDQDIDCNISIAINHIQYGTLYIRNGDAGPMKGISIVNNVFVDGNIIFKSDSGAHTKFEDISIRDNKMSFPTANHYMGIYFEGAGVATDPSENVDISNNIICALGINGAWIAGIYAKGVRSLTISGNKISSSPHLGIGCETCEDALVISNQIYDAGQKEAIDHGTGLYLGATISGHH